MALDNGTSPERAKRPCCMRVLEVLYAVNLVLGVAFAPAGMKMDAAVWLGAAMIAVLAISRLRMALVWLGMSACCIGFLIFIPVNAAFYITRMDGDPWAMARLALIFVVVAMTLKMLWSRKTTDWLRDSGSKLSMLVI